MPERGTVTLADVAARAGVSLATASRALNGSTRKVRQDSLDRVYAAAQELRYTANVQAQAVARGTTTTLALVVGDIADPYFSGIAAGAIRAADDAGLVVTITSTGATLRGRPPCSVSSPDSGRARSCSPAVVVGAHRSARRSLA
ncbi:LacI family DNA-binding transcriptional regulator [Curtobacterium flaccumfaciens]|nr:LacI family DNA-binding transcriptional regulator [Curtobacterium flaccumfaciens]